MPARGSSLRSPWNSIRLSRETGIPEIRYWSCVVKGSVPLPLYVSSVEEISIVPRYSESLLGIVLVAIRRTDEKENTPPRLELSHSFSAQTIHEQSYSSWEGSLISRRFFFVEASCEGRVRRKVSVSRCFCLARKKGEKTRGKSIWDWSLCF